ncbi:glutaredoxin [Sinobacterium caligoides]|uniref:Glutaredoxin n=1 Tax=Sinobacterium caligoides TaxID=933926 RepID=A0A3N2DQ19_9GAMM|nr:glutaredoxin [Sinobacterium caligoides]ROS01887.1 glutaredoxin [Sinobacterium caligoides]
MARLIWDSAKIHPAISEQVGGTFNDTVLEAQRAVNEQRVVVIGMASNPHCKKARKALDAASVEYTYLEYGSYTKEWKRRGALKMWAGWQTFPMVFVEQQLVGGRQQLEALLINGELTA